jgi:hypothetical protein
MATNGSSSEKILREVDISVGTDTGISSKVITEIIKDELRQRRRLVTVSVVTMALGFCLILLEILNVSRVSVELSDVQLFGVSIGHYAGGIGVVFFIIGVVLLKAEKDLVIRISKNRQNAEAPPKQ